MASYRLLVSTGRILAATSTTPAVLWSPTFLTQINGQYAQAVQAVQASIARATSPPYSAAEIARLKAAVSSTPPWSGVASNRGGGAFSFPSAGSEFDVTLNLALLTISAASLGMTVLVDAGALESPVTTNVWRTALVVNSGSASAIYAGGQIVPYTARASLSADASQPAPGGNLQLFAVAEDGSQYFGAGSPIFRGQALTTVGALGAGPALVETSSGTFSWAIF